MYATLLDHADTPAQLPVPPVGLDDVELVVLVDVEPVVLPDVAEPPEQALPRRAAMSMQ